jgi:hypothetical protein
MRLSAHFYLHHNQIRDYDESEMGTNEQDKCSYSLIKDDVSIGI